MKHIRNLLCFVICAATLILLVSCGKKDDAKPAASEQTPETTQINYTEKWVLEPSIEADKIYSLPLCTFNDDTNHYDVSFGSAYVIEKDGKFGFIDSNGKIIVEPKYDTVETCTCTEGYIATVKPEGAYRETYNINAVISSKHLDRKLKMSHNVSVPDTSTNFKKTIYLTRRIF